MSAGEVDGRLLDHVFERDVDLALVATFLLSAEFRTFVLAAVGVAAPHAFVRARVSESDAGGESDVVLVVDLQGGTRMGLLVEDKIDAALQPRQAARYRERGERGRIDGAWHAYRTLLFAPDAYLAGTARGDWDSCLSFEAAVAWAETRREGPHAVIAAICRQATAKHASGMRRAPHAAASEFWQAYRRLAEATVPDLPVTRLPAVVSDFPPWPRFGDGLLGRGVLLEHKPDKGRVDLTFDGVPLASLRGHLPPSLPEGIVPVATGRSSALRLAVPVIDHLRSFAEQLDAVRAALAAVARLADLARALPSLPIA